MYKTRKWKFEDKDQLLFMYSHLFGDHGWSFVARLGFNGAVAATKAEWAFRRWMSQIRRAAATRDFRWIRARETDKLCDEAYRIVVLVGGLRVVNPIAYPYYWRRIGSLWEIEFKRLKRGDNGILELGKYLERMTRVAIDLRSYNRRRLCP